MSRLNVLCVVAVLLTVSDQATAQCRIVSGGYGRYQTRYQSYTPYYGYYSPSYSYYSPSYYNYYSPSYETPVAYKDYVVQKVVAQEVAVAPLIVTVPVISYGVPIQNYGVGHYYSVQENYQQRANLREVVREELRAALAGLNGNGNGTYQQPPRQQPQQQQQLPKEEPASKGQRSDLGKDAVTPKDLAAKIVKAFTDTGCLGCHGGAKINGNLRLAYDESGVVTLARQSKERRWMIYGQASTGVMPPAARDDATKAMKQEHLPDLLRWVLQNEG
jgi:hypothetical protein